MFFMFFKNLHLFCLFYQNRHMITVLFALKVLTKIKLGYIINGKRLRFCGNPVRESVSQAGSTVGKVVSSGNALAL